MYKKAIDQLRFVMNNFSDCLLNSACLGADQIVEDRNSCYHKKNVDEATDCIHNETDDPSNYHYYGNYV